MNLKLTPRSKISRDLHKGISDFKKGYQPGTNSVTREVLYNILIDFDTP